MNDEGSSPKQKSGRIDIGNTHAGRDAHINLENVAGRDQISHSQVVQHAENVYLIGSDAQKPGFSEKPGFSPLQLPLNDIPKPGSLTPGSRMPLGLNPHFVGRERELKWLAETLQRGDTAAIGQMATITGLGGIGKSQLAITFAHLYGPFFEGGVFWVSMAEAANVPAELAQCGYAMNLGHGYENLTLEEQVRRVQQAWQEPIPRLLLFDNCEDEALLARWRPKTGGGRVLATSRRASWDSSLGVAALSLDTLTPLESRALLQNLASHLNDAQADTIAEELGYLPLALHLAGSYLHTYRHASFAQPDHYLNELKAERLEHLSLQGEGTSHSPTAHERHVGRTFALSLERLNPDDEVDQLALALLARAACFAPSTAIPRALLLASVGVNSDNRADQLRGEKGMTRLVGLGLLTVETETGWLVIHRLVWAFVWARQLDEEAQTEVEKIVNMEASRLNRFGYPRVLLAWQGQLRYVTEQAWTREDAVSAGLANELGYHLCALGEYTTARAFYERSLAIREHVLGPDHIYTTIGLNNLASLLQNQGEYVAARLCYERALAIRERVLGSDHPDTAQSLNNLALLQKTLGEYAAARLCYERALAIRERVLGSDHPDTAQSLNNLAELLRSLGDYAGALPLMAKALNIRERTLGQNHPDTAQSLNNLAGLLIVMGETATARTLMERALAVKERSLGPDHPSIAVSLNNLAGLLRDMEEYAAAHPLYERALTIWEHSLGLDHPNVAFGLNNLASLLHKQRKTAAARPLYERALTILEQKLGPDHPNTRLVRNNLASLGE